MKLTPTNKFPVLISYANLLERTKLKEAELFLDDPRFDVLLDSGAFTAKNVGIEIQLSDYMRFVKENEHRLFGYMALDKLQDPVQTDKNLEIMLAAGLKPIPVHVFGDDGDRMDYLFERSDLVALGGFRRPHRGAAPPGYVKQKMAWAAGRPVHWLGYTQEHMLRAFHPYSCDCSSWSGGHRFGRLDIYLGDGRWVSASRQQCDRIRSNEEAIKEIAKAGFSVKDLFDNDCWHRRLKKGIPYSRHLPLNIVTRSWAHYICEFQARFNVRIFLAHSLDMTASIVVKWVTEAMQCVESSTRSGLKLGTTGRKRLLSTST